MAGNQVPPLPQVPSDERCPATPSPPAGRARQPGSGPGRRFRQPPARRSPRPEPPGPARVMDGPARKSRAEAGGMGRDCRPPFAETCPARETARPFATESSTAGPLTRTGSQASRGSKAGALVVREAVRCARRDAPFAAAECGSDRTRFTEARTAQAAQCSNPRHPSQKRVHYTPPSGNAILYGWTTTGHRSAKRT
jgi:hypothetical protein